MSDSVTFSWVGRSSAIPPVYNGVTTTWFGHSAYTEPQYDTVTASFVLATPYPYAGDGVTFAWYIPREMPSVPVVLGFSFLAGSYPSIERGVDTPLAFGMALPADHTVSIAQVLNAPLAFSFTLPQQSYPSFSYVVDDPLLFRLLAGAEIPAYRISPEQAIPGYTSDGTNITIPIATLIGLTAAEADATTGDWREILQALLLQAVQYNQSWVWSLRPAAFSCSKVDYLLPRGIMRDLSFRFFADLCSCANVADEPN